MTNYRLTVFSCGLSIVPAVAVSMALTIGSFAQTNRFEELGNLPFTADYPTEETAQRRDGALRHAVFDRVCNLRPDLSERLFGVRARGAAHRDRHLCAAHPIWPESICRRTHDDVVTNAATGSGDTRGNVSRIRYSKSSRSTPDR